MSDSDQVHAEVAPARLGPAVRVLLVSAVLLAVATAAWHVYGDLAWSGDPAAGSWPWWAITVLTVASDLTVYHIQSRRESQIISLSELVFVPSLFFADPWSLVVGWTLASAVTSLWRRQSAMKLLFNACLSAAGSSLAVLVFHTVPTPPLGIDLHGWASAFAATSLLSVFDTVAVLVVIALMESGVGLRDVASETGRGLVATTLSTMVALVSVHALADTTLALVPVVGAMALLILGFRRYGDMAERYLTLERIHEVSRVISGTPEVDEINTRLLHQTRDALLADQVRLAFLVAGPGEGGVQQAVQVALDPSEGVRRDRVPAAVLRHPLWQRLVQDGVPTLAVRSTRDPLQRSLLAACGLEDAVLAPLRGEAGIVGGVVAGNRMGEFRSFDEHDLRLLVTICDQASTARQRGVLADRLRREADHDPLTGLPNRMLLHRRLAEATSTVRSGGSRGFAMLLVNVVEFRAVNEVLGHAVGDHVLQALAQRLTSVARPGDVVARIGGDEFAVLLAGQGEQAAALDMARSVKRALEGPIDVSGVDVEVGAWLGMALAPLHGVEPDAIMQCAETALATARQRKVEIYLYSEAGRTTADRARLALLGQLRQAIHNDELAMFVQPQAAASGRQVVGVEALVRWRHPERGLVGPGDFVPFAERTGLVRPMTMWMLARAVGACGSWQRGGEADRGGPAGAAHGLGIAVNLSPRSILDPDLPAQVETLLQLHMVPADLLTLEITESSVLDDPRRTFEVLERLKGLGVRISIDDFGTGYSSMTYLRDLPVDEVKIDRTFVRDMLRRSGDEAIVHSIITLASNLGLDTVAEGVEDEATWQRLEMLGCSRIQGFYLARPMPEQDLPGWVRESALRG